MGVRVVKSAVEPSTSRSRKPRRTSGKVERAARRVLRDIDTDHAAADLLSAVAERLAQDIDESAEVRDRVAASKELRELIEALDTGVMPPIVPSQSEGDADEDDPFEIGAVLPGVGDSEAG